MKRRMGYQLNKDEDVVLEDRPKPPFCHSIINGLYGKYKEAAEIWRSHTSSISEGQNFEWHEQEKQRSWLGTDPVPRSQLRRLYFSYKKVSSVTSLLRDIIWMNFGSVYGRCLSTTDLLKSPILIHSNLEFSLLSERAKMSYGVPGVHVEYNSIPLLSTMYSNNV